MATGVLAVSRDIFAGLYKMTVEGVLEIKPSPDWKGPPQAGCRQAMEAEAGTLQSGECKEVWPARSGGHSLTINAAPKKSKKRLCDFWELCVIMDL